MSGTDHALQNWSGPQPVFVLVRPQMGENIGAAARGMYNFGLEHMRLVAPRDGWPNEKAVAMASGASAVLDKLSVSSDLPAALGDMDHVYATTARKRDLTKEIVTPEAAMADAKTRIAGGQRVAVLFGPERAGLENDDIIRANTLISVPVNPGFASLNLAQCVLLTAYEWGRQGGVPAVREPDMPIASGAAIESLYIRMERELNARGFFWPDDKAESMRQSLRNMLSRMPMSDADVRTMHGVIRALAEKQPR